MNFPPPILLPSVDSTNNYAANLLLEGPLPEWTAIMADFQTEGKGQQNTQWHSSSKKNLLASIVFTPKSLSNHHIPLLSMAVALAVLDTLQMEGLHNLRIKWPNDILAERKKISGILLESKWNNNSLNYIIAGIGININEKQFPLGISATSLSLEGINGRKPVDILQSLRLNMFSRVNKISNKEEEIILEYHQNLFGYNEVCALNFDGEIREAKILGVDKGGRIQLLFSDNSKMVASPKSFSWMI